MIKNKMKKKIKRNCIINNYLTRPHLKIVIDRDIKYIYTYWFIASSKYYYKINFRSKSRTGKDLSSS